jgi:hypothetical protein
MATNLKLETSLVLFRKTLSNITIRTLKKGG